jgi:hypothetical protein
VLEQLGQPTRVMSAIAMNEICEPYIRRRAVRHLEKGRVVVMVAGTGNPYFTTDTAATLRAVEVHAQVILKATRVDGVYDADPEKHPEAQRYSHIGYTEKPEQPAPGARRDHQPAWRWTTTCRSDRVRHDRSGTSPARSAASPDRPADRRRGIPMTHEGAERDRAEDAQGHRAMGATSRRSGPAAPRPAWSRRITVDYYGTQTPR